MPGSLYTDRGSHYFHTPEAGGKVAKNQHTQVAFQPKSQTGVVIAAMGMVSLARGFAA